MKIINIHARPLRPFEKCPGTISLLPGSKKPQWKKLAVPATDIIQFIPWQDILYCESKSNYTFIVMRGGKTILCCKTLKEIESSLPQEDFLRIHSSYLVSLQAITGLKKQTGEIEINHDLMLPVSRARKKHIYRFLGVL